ncbi:1-aminocyclopropane-1-carboxylate deaminase/D-cysteine desulfhydrase [Microbulbifer litoralis]|uniref:1-aminocyclopropane-1-carboxylate deaminase/D-cysteine desulfhydrase n=1 Tax=Microbulbifer litoralis TaxID=2933965 RepID=UPI00202862C9|nr:pyridoxal-phosphate dependent enzyme [Microbulbifer sp. GX H0434]
MPPRYLTSLNLQAFIQAASEVPYQKIESDLFPGIELWIRRDDLLDPLISGNKAYKLIYNLIAAREQGADTLITCGGAWSNHLHATAAAGARFGFRTLGIIRGERPRLSSATLRDAERFGMEFRFVSREQYHSRNHPGFLEQLNIDPAEAVYLPEGGANLAGARGAQLLGKIIDKTCPIRFSQVWVACGTGVTVAGLSTGLKATPVYGVEVLKAGHSIARDTEYWSERLQHASPTREEMGGEGAVDPICRTSRQEIHLKNQYHCGGYAKCPHHLRAFQREFECQAGIPLDPVYTAKLMYGLCETARVGQLDASARILALHSGGLQGRRGFRPE